MVYKYVQKPSYNSTYNDLLSTEALLLKKLQPNLDNQIGPDKGSR